MSSVRHQTQRDSSLRGGAVLITAKAPLTGDFRSKGKAGRTEKRPPLRLRMKI